MSVKQRIATLRILQYIFIALMLYGGFLLLKDLSGYFGFTGNGPYIHGWVMMVTEHDEPIGTPHPDGSNGMTLYHSGHHKLVTLEFNEMSTMLRGRYLVYILSQSLAWILGISILYQMYRILRNLEDGRVFHMKNVRRIRLIALAALGIPIVHFFASWILVGITYTFHGHEYSTEIPDLHRERIIIGALVALVIFALGEIFRTGIRLKEEHDLAI